VGRLGALSIEGYRSFGEYTEVTLPRDKPLVLLGENSVGKSNLVRAIDLIFGETWPRSQLPDDHVFFDRDPNGTIDVIAELEGVTSDRYGVIYRLRWRFTPGADEPEFLMETEYDGERWANGEVRDQCFCLLVGADRRLSYQLSYASKWTFLSRLMRRFHKELTADVELVERLKNLFGEIVESFARLDHFSAFSTGLRAQVERFGASMSYGLEIDFSAYDPSNFFHSLRVYPQSDGATRTFEELGTGQEQVLAIAFACAYAHAFGSHQDAGLILVIEEPEAHLHPLAQRWLGRTIHEVAAEGVQVVVTTHSPAFVDLHNLNGIVVVRRDGEQGSSTVIQHSEASLTRHCRETGATKATAENIGAFYATSGTEETISGLFARSCLVVEGPTDSLGFPVLLQKVGLDPLRAFVQVVNVGGIGNIARWWRLYTAYGLPTYVIFDSDSDDDSDGVRRQELLQAIGVSLSEYKAAVASGPLGITSRFAVCVTNYEVAMRRLFSDQYGELEELGRTRVGTGKPIVARYVAQRLRIEQDPGGWASIRTLAESIVGRAPGLGIA
jgi:putative ATP-dependent endonuclease of OLD family